MVIYVQTIYKIRPVNHNYMSTFLLFFIGFRMFGCSSRSQKGNFPSSCWKSTDLHSTMVDAVTSTKICKLNHTFNIPPPPWPFLDLNNYPRTVIDKTWNKITTEEIREVNVPKLWTNERKSCNHANKFVKITISLICWKCYLLDSLYHLE